MNLVTSVIAIATFLSFILANVSFCLPEIKPEHETLSAYVCGFDPLASAGLSLSVRFLLVAIHILVFALVIALLLSLACGDEVETPFLTFLCGSVVLALLSLRLIYKWIHGAMESAE
uniref:NADH-ubiquinone oxidoreductase chain 3 n=1 Tax=Selaroides leptolepis TaxID=173311 RepID=A0A109WZJ8_SELLE|nr:NADH dehydrogenase subunit 3 [Selaroides leptolepis]